MVPCIECKTRTDGWRILLSLWHFMHWAFVCMALHALGPYKDHMEGTSIDLHVGCPL